MTTDWRQQAACAGMATADTDIFTGDNTNAEDVAYAKTICRRCPVTTECMVTAIKHGPVYGVWAGRFHAVKERGRMRA
jgi:WhiB family redox-sensing transcriptional regulator